MNRYCLKDLGNNIQGEIGEVLASRIIPYAHRVKGKDIEFLNQKFYFEIPTEVKQFLIKNWLSLDLFKFIVDENTKKFVNLELIEVKTKSHPFQTKHYNKRNITKNTFEIYKIADKLNFITTLAEIKFHSSWEFTITTKPLFKSKFSLVSQLHPNEMQNIVK